MLGTGQELVRERWIRAWNDEVMQLIGIRRHPVKAMAGESLRACEVSPRGMHGDRWYAVHDAEGHFVTGKNSRRFRKHDEIFEFGARTLGREGEVEVYRHDGATGPWAAGDPTLDAHLSERMGEPVGIRGEGEVSHFDDAPVSVIGTASLAWFAEHHDLTVDDRRIRANLVVETSEPFVEETWSAVRIGSLDFAVVKPITRCRMVDLPQNGLTDSIGLLKTLGATREVKLGVYLAPQGSGELALADAVTARDRLSRVTDLPARGSQRR